MKFGGSLSIGLDLNKSSPRWRIVEKSEAKTNFATVSMQALEKQNQIEFVSRKERMEKGDGFENNNNYLLYFQLFYSLHSANNFPINS